MGKALRNLDLYLYSDYAHRCLYDERHFLVQVVSILCLSACRVCVHAGC